MVNLAQQRFEWYFKGLADFELSLMISDTLLRPKRFMISQKISQF
jgi:hypothetical protein